MSPEEEAAAVSGEHAATGPTPEAIMQLGSVLLGFEDAAQRRRAGGVLRACERRAARRRRTARASRAASARRPRLLRRAGGARDARARRRALSQCARHRPVPRPGEAELRRRHPRDGRTRDCSSSGARSPRGCAPASRRTRPSRAATCSPRIYSDPQRLSGFLEAMSGISAGAAHAIAATFPWERYQTVIDVGCAEGCVPVTIAPRHPHMTGGGFDLPAVEPHFDEYVARAGLGDRLRVPRRGFLRRPIAERGRADHGPHPARLGPRREASACSRRPTPRFPTAAR